MHQGKGNERSIATFKWRMRVLSLVGLLWIPFISGCWDSVELNQRAIVAAIAIDMDGESGYEVSLQVIVASEILGNKGRGDSPVVLYQQKGKSIYQAIRRASQKIPRDISLSHVRLVVLGEKLARHGIGHTLDFMERYVETRSTMKMMVARGKTGKDVLASMTAMGRIPARDISGKLERSQRMYAGHYSVNLDDVIRGMSNKGGGPVITGVEVDGDLEQARKSKLETIIPEAMVHIKGMGVFRKDRLIYWLDDAKAVGLSMVNNKITGSEMVLDYGKESGVIGITTVFSRTRIHSLMERGKPVFIVDLEQTGSIDEVESAIDMKNPQVMKYLQYQWSRETRKIMESVIRDVQRINSDVLGFGHELEMSHPTQWEKLSSQWSRHFAESAVRVHVTSVIKQSQTLIERHSRSDTD
ncbi:MAG: Ger(x)C family spore germination protein [Bacillota bacterium]